MGEDELPRRVTFDVGYGDDSPMSTRMGLGVAEDSALTLGDGGEAAAAARPSRKLLVELFDLHGGDESAEWLETARWLKYEEDAEGVDRHWGRPHVACLSFHALIQLRQCVSKGALLLNSNMSSFDEVCTAISLEMGRQFEMDEKRLTAILNTLKRNHKHVDGHNANLQRMQRTHNLENRLGEPLPKMSRQESSRLMPKLSVPSWISHGARKASTPGRLYQRDMETRRTGSGPAFDTLDLPANTSSVSFHQVASDHHLSRHLPDDAEAAQVFVGTVAELERVRFAMVRLAEAQYMAELMEAPVPIRFILVLIGPPLVDVDYHELGRSMATLMANDGFRATASAATEREQLVRAMDDFFDQTVVLSPGEVDNKELLSVHEIQKALNSRRRDDVQTAAGDDASERKLSPTTLRRRASGGLAGLERTGRPFGGLVRDVCRRAPFYKSDWMDALDFRCLTSIVFIFFATFAPAITFGGLLGAYTDDTMGITETLISQCICGVAWGFFSAQPLLIVAATGPILIFEASLFTVCRVLALDFLTLRLWSGAWVFVLALLTTLFEGTFTLRYVTRFTEDIFATLISAIFIGESVKFLLKTFELNPMRNLHFYTSMEQGCLTDVSPGTSVPPLLNGSSTGEAPYCTKVNQPDTGLLTACLMVATFVLAFAFKKLRSSYYLGRTVRQAIGDFGVLIAILIVTSLYVVFAQSAYIETIDVHPSFGFTMPAKRGHGLLVSWRMSQWWGYPFALLPAALIYILLFVETEITQLLLAKKERGLRKGGGFHFDLVLVGALAFVCGLLGLPWMCAAAVQSLAHASSLTLMRRHAPGERPRVDRVIEQRVTPVAVALLVGVCAFAGRYLQLLPLAVLFGVFLYLGTMNLVGVQLIHRVVLMFLPQKYFPDHSYCQKVSMWRMHLYSVIQLVCLAIVYTVKHFKSTALAFPFILLLTGVLRQLLIPKMFTSDELRALDGHEDDEEQEDFFDVVTIPV